MTHTHTHTAVRMATYIGDMCCVLVRCKCPSAPMKCCGLPAVLTPACAPTPRARPSAYTTPRCTRDSWLPPRRIPRPLSYQRALCPRVNTGYETWNKRGHLATCVCAQTCVLSCLSSLPHRWVESQTPVLLPGTHWASCRAEGLARGPALLCRATGCSCLVFAAKQAT